MRCLVMLSVSLVLLVSLAAAQHANVAATYKGEPVLPTQGVAVETPPASADKRPELVVFGLRQRLFGIFHTGSLHKIV